MDEKEQNNGLEHREKTSQTSGEIQEAMEQNKIDAQKTARPKPDEFEGWADLPRRAENDVFGPSKLNSMNTTKSVPPSLALLRRPQLALPSKAQTASPSPPAQGGEGWGEEGHSSCGWTVRQQLDAPLLGPL